MTIYKYRPVYDNEDINEALQDIEQTFTEAEISNDPAFLNSWVDEGSAGFLKVGFWKTIHGIVYLEGRIKNGVIGSACFVLPRLYRPPGTVVFSVVSNDLFGQVRVYADGNVIPQSPSSNVYIALDGIYFRAAKE